MFTLLAQLPFVVRMYRRHTLYSFKFWPQVFRWVLFWTCDFGFKKFNKRGEAADDISQEISKQSHPNFFVLFLSSHHPVLFSSVSLIACKFVLLSIYQLVNLLACKLVSFSAYASWSLRACLWWISEELYWSSSPSVPSSNVVFQIKVVTEIMRLTQFLWDKLLPHYDSGFSVSDPKTCFRLGLECFWQITALGIALNPCGYHTVLATWFTVQSTSTVLREAVHFT